MLYEQESRLNQMNEPHWVYLCCERLLFSRRSYVCSKSAQKMGSGKPQKQRGRDKEKR
jgi:hypothetical protein